MKTEKRYVLGFAFDQNADNVILIEKQRPDWQKGKLNGVGGKIEESDKCWNGNDVNWNDTAGLAMVREFKEETGADTKIGGEYGWQLFATMIFEDDVMGGKSIVYCFKLFSNLIYQCETVEDEEIRLVSLDDVMQENIIDNLPVLIPMALHKGIKFSEINY